MSGYNRRSVIDTTAKRSRVFGVPMIAAAISESNPWRSLAASCMPRQVAEFNEFYRHNGIVGAQHTADGTLECTSRAARKAVGKLRGIHDNDACYGDHNGN